MEENIKFFEKMIGLYMGQHSADNSDNIYEVNIDMWSYIQSINDYSIQELAGATKILEERLDDAKVNQNEQGWAELYCLLALLYEKMGDKKSAYLNFEKAINSRCLYSEVFRAYSRCMVKFNEPYKKHISLVNSWVEEFSFNPRPYIHGALLSFSQNRELCEDYLNALAEIGDGEYYYYISLIRKGLKGKKQVNAMKEFDYLF